MNKAFTFCIIGILLGIIVGGFTGNNISLNGEKDYCYDDRHKRFINEMCITDNWVDTRTESVFLGMLIGCGIFGAFGLFIGGMEDIRREIF